MTEAEARKVKDPRGLPWDTACIVFVSGRYYLGMWYVAVPAGKEWPFGGNILLQCWRYENTPSEWVITFRFRYYADDSGQVWNSADKRTWYASKWTSDEATIENRMARFTDEVSGITGLSQLTQPLPVQSLIFKGDSEKALAIIAKEKPAWMQMKISQ
jgi:hypothetical protein